MLYMQKVPLGPFLAMPSTCAPALRSRRGFCHPCKRFPWPVSPCRMVRADGGQRDGTTQHNAGAGSTFSAQTHFCLGTLGLRESVLAAGEWATGTKAWKRMSA